jgi:type 1 glutamine amidotransferase/nicotinamidase-related amidase
MPSETAPDRPLELKLRSRLSDPKDSVPFRVSEKAVSWDPRKTAIIVCDMWDLHHCLNATRRGGELAPRMDDVLRAARDRGSLVIHAPSSCMDSYKGHPARKRAQETRRSKSLPAEISKWCYKIPAEERGTYPIDQTDGGEDDDLAEHKIWATRLAALGRDPKAPWKSQTARLSIDAERDVISDDGEEIWSVLEARGIDNVILLGVHLNMCVLGRPFGLRQMAKNGKNVVLMRDMTDTMYNPLRSPHVSHFSGTDLMIEHVEKFVCPTITSDQLLGGKPFRFKDDLRPHVVFLIGEDEYQTAKTLPEFAAKQLAKDFRISVVFSGTDQPNDLPGIEVLDDADLAFVSVRRRLLPKEQLDHLRRFVAAGKPLVGIRTASHAFSPRGKESIPSGRAAWASFDSDVLGGSYRGHHPEGAAQPLTSIHSAIDHPILSEISIPKLAAHGSLYQVLPLAASATPLLQGSIPGQPAEPIAWTNLSFAGGRVFYTSLGHPDDFTNPEFSRFLRNAVYWAASRDVPKADTIAIPTRQPQ